MSDPERKSKSGTPRRLMLAASAAAFFWILTLHIQTDCLDFMTKDGVGSRSGIVALIDDVIQSVLVEPLGRHLASAVLFMTGIGAAWLVGRSPGNGNVHPKQYREPEAVPENNPRKRGFGRKTAIITTTEDEDLVERTEGENLLLDIVQNEKETLEMQKNARQQVRSVATLTPIVPLSSDDKDSWFGGNPRLPKESSWPEKDGKQLCFACQVNLSSLPIDIWSGAGPREGWLAFFLHPETAEATVLHFQGEVEECNGPGQMSAGWARTYATYAAESKTYFLPRWPVKIEARRPCSTTRSIHDPNDIWKDIKPDLANAEIHPFDSASLSTLLDSLEEYFVKQFKFLSRFPAMKKLRQEDLDWMRDTKHIALRSLEEFYKFEAQLAGSRYRFDRAKVASLLPTIAKLPTYEIEYRKDDDEGYCCLEYGHSTLDEVPTLSRVLPIWWDRYTSKLYWLSINAYTADPTVLQSSLRGRMERIWSQDANGFNGAMGHAPRGHMYTPHGPSTDTEVLLELPTSQMQGWIWGDCYSIVLTIKRKALSQGDFSEIGMDITN